MDLIPALASLVWILSCYSIQTKCDNLDVIKYSAANTSLVRDTKTGLHLADFVKLQNKYLSVTPFKVLHLKKKETCLLRCEANLNCLSLNVAKFPDSNGQYKCELLDKVLFHLPNELKNISQFLHFTFKTNCLFKPCKNNGVCIPVYTNDTYTCKCPQRNMGVHCENVGNYPTRGHKLLLMDKCPRVVSMHRRLPSKSLQNKKNDYCVHPQGGYDKENVHLVYWNTCDESKLILDFFKL
ncbi:hypothetical protein QZH41_018036, partial [Actinostola sp. cb2023]